MASGRRQYPFHLIEPKWRKVWDEQQTFRAFNPGEPIPADHPFAKRHGVSGKVAATQLPAKFYILDMFPYPSGAGLHVGHPEGYTATDILARYKRACGLHVLHPMGWDAFGLPAEQYAVKTGQHPRQTTEQNIATFKRQIQSLGFSYDWSRELATTDPDYFKWTQWIFLKLYNSWFNPETNRAEPIETLRYPPEPERAAGTLPAEQNSSQVCQQDAGSTLESARGAWRDKHRLAYVTDAPVWWCPALGTVLANEEVVDGKSEVGGHPVERKPMRQWMLRITAYAEKLLADLDTIDWSDSLKEMQRNWIGRSEGAEVDFALAIDFPSVALVQEYLEEQVLRSEIPDALRPVAKTLIANIDEHGYLGATIEELSSSTTISVEVIAEALKAVQKFHPAGVGARDLRECLLLQFERERRESTLEYRIVHDFMDELGKQRLLEIARCTGEGLSNVQDAVERISHMEPRPGRALVPSDKIRVFTTRPDTLFGTTYMVLSPEHKLVDQITTAEQRDAVAKYKAEVAKKSDLERTELAKEKTGVFTGAYAINPVNGERIPIWIADYVLASYGTGAIMAVPAHDARDFEFATKFNLPIVQVVQPPDPKTDWRGCVDEGTSVNSTGPEISINGLPTAEAKKKITDWLEAKGLGKRTINYKLRDWLFSRQRYWGEPFPIVWKRDASGALYHEALPESALPVLPPALTDYKPTATGEPPLARAKDWVNLPDGSTRETNTMPQWAGSCWYYLRYLDAKNAQSFVGKEAESYWMGADQQRAAGILPADQSKIGSAAGTDGSMLRTTPGVDLYVGGTEHAVLHLLYARFWHKVLFDLGYVSTPEPFFKLVNQGMILGEDGQKMSKARGNVINPDDMVREFGADSFRLYEMFMGPLQDTKPWSTKGVEGVYRFLGRVWRLFVDEASETEFEQAETVANTQMRETPNPLLGLIKLDARMQDVQATPAQLKTLHACIKKVTEDLDGMRFNTAISAMMVFVNEAMTWETKSVSVLRDFLILLQPFAPHVAEELWAKLTSAFSLQASALPYAPWPKFDAALLVEDTLEIPVQVNGKLRDVIKVPANADNATLEAAAKASEKVQQFIAGKTIKKVIVVPKKLVNIAVA